MLCHGLQDLCPRSGLTSRRLVEACEICKPQSASPVCSWLWSHSPCQWPRGANAGLTDAGGRAPLHWAAHNDADGVLRLLLVAPGVDRGAVDGQGLTALDLALQNEAEEAIAVLQGMES